MTLVKCSECGKEVSNQAAACPLCGNPLPHGQPKELPTLRSMLSSRGKSSFGSHDTPHLATDGQQKPWHQRSISPGAGCFILVAIFGLVIGFAGWCAESGGRDSRQPSAPSGCSSNNCVVRAPTGGEVVVLAVSKEALDEMISSGSDRAIAVMVLNGSAFLVPQNTPVSIVDRSFGAKKVLVLEPGPTLGRTGWVLDEWVVDRQ